MIGACPSRPIIRNARGGQQVRSALGIFRASERGPGGRSRGDDSHSQGDCLPCSKKVILSPPYALAPGQPGCGPELPVGHHSLLPPRRSPRQRALRPPPRSRQRGPRRACDGGRFVPALLRRLRLGRGGTNLHFVGDWWFRIVDPSGLVPIAVPWGLLVDWLSGTLLLVVTGVGFLIHLYSVGYMSHGTTPATRGSSAYLNLFVFRDAHAGAGLQPRADLRGLGRAWGSASYLLIGFWYTDEEKASTPAARPSSPTGSACPIFHRCTKVPGVFSLCRSVYTAGVRSSRESDSAHPVAQGWRRQGGPHSSSPVLPWEAHTMQRQMCRLARRRFCPCGPGVRSRSRQGRSRWAFSCSSSWLPEPGSFFQVPRQWQE